ncbi:WHEP-TRS domain protein [Teladorsagia circumcincta]|uniref:WHEP-TRS domain protein n=1 Tax=Teladorsagia circumcincta TaxID=45464 RepID=A0A2G9TTU6_TELCI|nr:WHEP-TRS domain protein [Teladorsagia circumcincta]
MATPEIEAQLAPLRIAVKEYGDLIRELKANGAPKIDIDKAVTELKARKKKLEDTLVAEKKLDEPRTVNVVEVVPNMAVLGKEFKKDAKSIQIALAQMSEENIESLEKHIQTEAFKLKVDNDEFSLTSNMLSVKRSTKTVHVEEITPSVIEPSFGIGRVMYAVLEHSFRQREGDEQRTVGMLRRFIDKHVFVIPLKRRIHIIVPSFQTSEAVCYPFLARDVCLHQVAHPLSSLEDGWLRRDAECRPPMAD